MLGLNNKQMTPFANFYNLAKFGITANKVCQPAIYTKVGSYTVLAGEKVTFGVGGVGNVDTRSVAYARFDNESGVQLHGSVRLVLSDPREINRRVITEVRTEKLSADMNDKAKGLLLGEYPMKAKQDSLLLIEFLPDDDSAVTIDFDGTNSKLLMPVTIYQ